MKIVEEKIHILPTHNTPEVIFTSEGVIKIKGRALSLNDTEFPEQITRGFEVYLTNPPETTYVIIAFEYLNSFSAKILVSLLKKLSEKILYPKKLVIKWYYEEDDEDMLELGQYIAEANNLPVELVKTDDLAGL